MFDAKFILWWWGGEIIYGTQKSPNVILRFCREAFTREQHLLRLDDDVCTDYFELGTYLFSNKMFGNLG